jgi:hypothetical protein
LLKVYSAVSDKISSYSINSDNSKNRILIATQKTNYKDDAMQAIIGNFDKQNVFISVIDVRQLPNIVSDDWDKIIIFSAIKMYEFHPGIVKYLKNSKNDDRIFMYNTSGGTLMTYGEIDTVTSASINPQNAASEIINAINSVLQ